MFQNYVNNKSQEEISRNCPVCLIWSTKRLITPRGCPAFATKPRVVFSFASIPKATHNLRVLEGCSDAHRLSSQAQICRHMSHATCRYVCCCSFPESAHPHHDSDRPSQFDLPRKHSPFLEFCDYGTCPTGFIVALATVILPLKRLEIVEIVRSTA